MSDRTIYEISGPDAEHFLQGLVTNDIGRLKAGPVYAALLSPQGKYLADFILVRRGDTILLDIAAPIAEATIRRLSMYRLRAKADIAPSALHVFRGTGPAPEGALPDPRHPALGWRLYGGRDGDDGSDWNAIRVAHCIPETGIELTPESYILECGFERLHGVDFRKGCYVGQEVTARMKHKTELRKGLTRVALSEAVPPGTAILAVAEDGATRPAGTVHTVSASMASAPASGPTSGCEAIAYLRFDRAAAPLRAGDARVTPLG